MSCGILCKNHECTNQCDCLQLVITEPRFFAIDPHESERGKIKAISYIHTATRYVLKYGGSDTGMYAYLIGSYYDYQPTINHLTV